MNGHPRAALDPRIEPPESPMNWTGFYGFKPTNYGLQERLMRKKVVQTKNPANIFLGEPIFCV